jgi:hypothetical protein
LVPKWLKPFQGLKRLIALLPHKLRNFKGSKMAETLSGIETTKYQIMGATANVPKVPKWLKPFQGLKHLAW